MTRPPDTLPGSAAPNDRRQRDLAERLRASRDRLAASDLAHRGQAWRLWSVCVAQTFGYTRLADRTYAVALGREAGLDRKAAASLLRRFDELGVFGWEAAPHGSHAASTLRLPPQGVPTPPEGVAQGVPTPPEARQATSSGGAHAPLHSNESLSHGHDPCRGVPENPCGLEGHEGLEGQEAEAGPDPDATYRDMAARLDRDLAVREAVARAVAHLTPGPDVPPDPDADLLARFPAEATSAQMDTDAWLLRHR